MSDHDPQGDDDFLHGGVRDERTLPRPELPSFLTPTVLARIDEANRLGQLRTLAVNDFKRAREAYFQDPTEERRKAATEAHERALKASEEHWAERCLVLAEVEPLIGVHAATIVPCLCGAPGSPGPCPEPVHGHHPLCLGRRAGHVTTKTPTEEFFKDTASLQQRARQLMREGYMCLVLGSLPAGEWEGYSCFLPVEGGPHKDHIYLNFELGASREGDPQAIYS